MEQRAPREPKRAPREPQESPREPESTRCSSREPQESKCQLTRNSRQAKKAPREPKRVPRDPQESPRELQKSPRDVHEGTKMELPCRSGDDFRDFGGTPALGLLWAVLRPQDSPETAQESPRQPRRPQESPRGSQRLSVRSLEAVLELSWGCLEQGSCSANLSFTEAKLRPLKSTDLS